MDEVNTWQEDVPQILTNSWVYVAVNNIMWGAGQAACHWSQGGRKQTAY